MVFSIIQSYLVEIEKVTLKRQILIGFTLQRRKEIFSFGPMKFFEFHFHQ